MNGDKNKKFVYCNKFKCKYNKKGICRKRIIELGVDDYDYTICVNDSTLKFSNLPIGWIEKSRDKYDKKD